MNTQNTRNIIYSTIIIAGIMICAIAVYVIIQNTKMASNDMRNTSNTSPTVVENTVTTNDGTVQAVEDGATNQQAIETLFDLDSKKPSTELFYSEQLGFGFTYLPRPENVPTAEITVTEKGDMIYIHDVKSAPETGQSIQVFTKDEKLTLEEAIQDRFLEGYDPKNCFPAALENSLESLPAGYRAAVIDFAEELVADDSEAWFDIGDACPVGYTQTNAVQYFMMNPDVPGKYLFVKLGQDSFTQDGSTGEVDAPLRDWSYSLRIVQ